MKTKMLVKENISTSLPIEHVNIHRTTLTFTNPNAH